MTDGLETLILGFVTPDFFYYYYAYLRQVNRVRYLNKRLKSFIDWVQGRNLQNFLSKFKGFLVILGLKILRLFWLKVLFEADIIKG